jgi:signal transduction histidine kinase
MTPQTRARIFEPFFTTKESTGTGLGLWVSSEILAKHSATVRVASRPDDGSSKPCGTVFMIFFPEDGIEVAQPPVMVAETEPV